MFRKETVFEGYFVSFYETSYLSKEPEFVGPGWSWERMRRWFREYLKQKLQEKPEKEPVIISLEDMMPRQVFEKLLKNPDAKFHFKILVKAEELG